MVVVKKSDATLRREVLDELKWDARVSTIDVRVAVKGGVVRLDGIVDSWPKRVAVEEAAYRVSGVADVANDLVVRLPGSAVRDDAELALEVRHALICDVSVPAAVVHTTVEGGAVTLEGDVDSWAEFDDAARAIRNLPGVRSVVNKLTVKPRTMRSEELKQTITKALERRAEREADRIKVVVDNGTVTLTGAVGSWREREAVTVAVRRTVGVRRVEDHLRIHP